MKNVLLIFTSVTLFFIRSSHAVQSNSHKSDLLRIVCEETDHRGIRLGKVMVINQVSSDMISGTKLLADGLITKTPKIDFSLKVFEAKIKADEDLNTQIEKIMNKSKPLPINKSGDEIIGEGDIFANSFAFNYRGTDRVNFVLSFNGLDTGRYSLNSRTRTNRFECKKPYTIPTPEKVDMESEDFVEDGEGYEEDSEA